MTYRLRGVVFKHKTSSNGGITRRQTGGSQHCDEHSLEHKMSAEGMDRHIPFKERIRHFTWAWFTLTMSTGGLALLLSETPHRFTGLDIIAKIIYVFDLVLFVLLCTGITMRFVRDTGALRRSLQHPSEALFFATFWLSIPTIIGGMQRFGASSVGLWLPIVERILFWLYVACTLIVAVVQYYHLFTAQVLTAQSMTPAWILPVFPVMLSGTVASLIAPSQPPDQRLPILVAGITFQGLGIMVSMLMYATWIMRLMQYGLPAPDLRPGMFITVGPPSFTGLALIGMANALPDGYGYFAAYPQAVEILKVVSLFAAIFLWALSLWFFAIAVISVLATAREMSFHLVWWALVFPNTGFTIATISIGVQLESQAIQWVGSVMTILIIIAWLAVLCSHAWAVSTGRIMMPGLDEDKDQEEKA